jgi:hypothetical protein
MTQIGIDAIQSLVMQRDGVVIQKNIGFLEKIDKNLCIAQQSPIVLAGLCFGLS